MIGSTSWHLGAIGAAFNDQWKSIQNTQFWIVCVQSLALSLFSDTPYYKETMVLSVAMQLHKVVEKYMCSKVEFSGQCAKPKAAHWNLEIFQSPLLPQIW